MTDSPAPSFEYPEETYLIGGESVRVVCTDGVLDGKPRLDGHRVAVHYVYAKHERGRSVEELHDGVYAQLSEAEIRAALKYAEEHPDVLSDVARVEKEEWEQISNESPESDV
ncbi:MAG: DUF433 domain-containing protein [Halobaculum sp.]